MTKKSFMIVLILLMSTTSLFALSKYVIGYRYYIRYVKHIPKYGIKTPELLKTFMIAVYNGKIPPGCN
ncbi:hypothetical protein FE773_08280 [Caminibacter mediatlanticus TB-2]|uniref:Uncharacterized protein n=1 Tax=Caminibacter mediatlanticus TB-2 TaxID=391592 RepID=A0AAI9F2A2_9BACT|nr:hypothetical protein [Caminibacter mediatlanticus]EDM24542.1 hypothetical protein CMTB2_03463 [Caminibacter mediatlanticus TB-2]QCT95187.1 hypothetical protein FE773_08280 [Caminibacter mediatlanticus TB-2]